jgi:predicted HicB family RNase H-like nuclease
MYGKGYIEAMENHEQKRGKRGPAPWPADKKRGERIEVRVTPKEKRAIVAEARRRGISVGELLVSPWRKGK